MNRLNQITKTLTKFRDMGNMRILLWMCPMALTIMGSALQAATTDAGVGSIQLTSEPPSLTNSTVATFTFSAVGKRITLTNFVCTLDGVASLCQSPYTTAPLTNGVHSFTVANKFASSSASWSWTIDTTPPTVPVVSGPTAPTNQDTATLAISAQDSVAITSYQCSLDGYPLASCQNPQLVTVSADGSHTFVVTSVTDALGNVQKTPSAPFTWLVDTTAPTVTLTNTPYLNFYRYSNTSTVSFTASATDGGSGIQTVSCALDSTAVACANNVPFTTPSLTPGPHTLVVSATDNAGNGSSASFSWNYVTPQQQTQAAQTVAANATQCQAIQPFYWEIGTGASSSQPLASGSLGIYSNTGKPIQRNEVFGLASASKWIFGSYGVQELAKNGAVDPTSQAFLHMSSGYNTFVDSACGSEYGVNTVNDCEYMYCQIDARGNLITCNLDASAIKPVAGATIQRDSTFTPSDYMHFSYSGGHFQRFAVGQSVNNSQYGDNMPWPYGFNMGDEVYNGSRLTSNPLLSTDVYSELLLSSFGLGYSFPQLAGGATASAATYAAFLQSILNQQLQMYNFLGKDAVCTNPNDPNCTCVDPANNATYNNCNALYTPIPEENMHYSYGHWVEDDYTQQYADGSFNSAGAFGFYPWIDSTKTYYGVISRMAPMGPVNSDSTIGEGYGSELCGRQIRHAFLTGLTQ